LFNYRITKQELLFASRQPRVSIAASAASASAFYTRYRFFSQNRAAFSTNITLRPAAAG
jgi:hypothetical protein